MIDVLTVRARDAEVSGSALYSNGIISLNSPSVWPNVVEGQATYTPIEPRDMTMWLSAIVTSVDDQSTDAVRLRFIGDDTVTRYLSETTWKFEPVTATDWSTQYTRPAALSCLDLWTLASLQVVVGLVSTESFPRPTIGDLLVAIDIPAWDGAVAQAARCTAEAIADVEPLLVHSETLTEDRSEWRIGVPYSELNLDLTELVRVTINGVHKSASLAGGIVTLSGPSAKVGDSIRIAAKFKPSTAVRRVGTVRVIDKTPAWVISNIVTEGGMNGHISPLDINGIEVTRRKATIQMTVRGVASRQIDALAMRAALQSALADGVSVVLDSSRELIAFVDGLIEILAGGSRMLPECFAIVKLPMDEFVDYRRIRNARYVDQYGNTVLRTNTVTLDFGSFHVEADAADFAASATPCPFGDGC